MPAMHCPNILVFAEGDMERMFLNGNFRHAHVITVFNGGSWTAEKLAGQIASKFHVHDGNPDLIVVWIDKEKQPISCDDFRKKIHDALVSKGAQTDKIHICLPDQMSENLILADETAMKEEFKDQDYRYKFEGQDGEAILSKMYRDKGEFYKKTNHGVKLLKKIRVRRASKNSPSIQSFVENFPIDCWWLSEDN